MRQEVNLYRDALRPVQIPLPARQMLILLGLLTGLLVLFWVGLSVRVLVVEGELADLHAEQVAQQGQIARVTEQLAQRVKSPVLEQQVQQLERDLRIKRQLLGAVADGAHGNTDGFSAALAGLGRHQRDGLWFRQIHFSRGGAGLTLSGSTLDARELPAYLQALAVEPAYAGREFGTFWLRRPEPSAGRRLDFVISTHCQVDAEGGCVEEALQ